MRSLLLLSLLICICSSASAGDTEPDWAKRGVFLAKHGTGVAVYVVIEGALQSEQGLYYCSMRSQWRDRARAELMKTKDIHQSGGSTYSAGSFSGIVEEVGGWVRSDPPSLRLLYRASMPTSVLRQSGVDPFDEPHPKERAFFAMERWKPICSDLNQALVQKRTGAFENAVGDSRHLLTRDMPAWVKEGRGRIAFLAGSPGKPSMFYVQRISPARLRDRLCPVDAMLEKLERNANSIGAFRVHSFHDKNGRVDTTGLPAREVEALVGLWLKVDPTGLGRDPFEGYSLHRFPVADGEFKGADPFDAPEVDEDPLATVEALKRYCTIVKTDGPRVPELNPRPTVNARPVRSKPEPPAKRTLVETEPADPEPEPSVNGGLPRQVDRWYASASKAIEAGEYQEAVRELRLCVEVDPQFAEAYGKLGLALDHLDRYKKSIAAYRRFLKLAPKHQQAAAIRDRIRVLRFKAKSRRRR